MFLEGSPRMSDSPPGHPPPATTRTPHANYLVPAGIAQNFIVSRLAVRFARAAPRVDVSDLQVVEHAVTAAKLIQRENSAKTALTPVQRRQLDQILRFYRSSTGRTAIGDRQVLTIYFDDLD